MNYNFGHLDDNGRLVYAANVVTVDGRTYFNPSAATYLRATPPEKRIVNSQPVEPAPAGKHWETRGWNETDTEVVRVHVLVDDPPAPPRRWTRLTIKGALADAHLLPAAKEFLAAYELKPNYNALEAFSDCDYIEEGYGGDEVWNSLLNGAAQALSKTRAEIDVFLDSLPTEP